ncbi:MAG TPA: protein kinase [Gammaproteobacteria bacterium]|nr:protein kinase [Gammaproteobacteria bacterium]HPI95244.1 protein kinase [Gammaproteobacteria bacterium]HPQ87333.1 protein kinase [Gammaproteobacteria bacterium]
MNSSDSLQNWKKARELFEQYIDLPKDKAISQITSDTSIEEIVKPILINLIQSQSDEDTLINEPDLVFFQVAGEESEDLSGKNIEEYHLINRIGQGGMSNVYKAKRRNSDIQKYVALKLLTIVEGDISDSLRGMFEREQITLSKLSHPNIISFHHGGISKNGIPFLVMDYIEDAQTISQYVVDKKLSEKQILRLIIKVAQAVDYAHQNLITHKDIKPNNILIDSMGNPKVVDFGIASFEQLDDLEDSAYTNKIFTPDYASPEQINHENITSNTDVFSLAITLLELLSGNQKLSNSDCINPQQKFDSDIFEKKTAQTMTKLRLKKDLSLVLQKALMVDSRKRYSSMAMLADDLNAYLELRPVSVRKQSNLYLLTKSIIRNPLLSFVVATSIFSLIIGIKVIVEEKNKAQQEALKANQVTNFLIDSIQMNDPDVTKGKEVSVKELLMNAKVKILETSFNDSELSSALELTIGSALSKIGQYSEAEKLLSNSIKSDSGNYSARMELVRLFLEQHEYKKAEAELKFLKGQISNLQMSEQILFSQLSSLLSYKQGNFEEAISKLNTVIGNNSATLKDKISSRLVLAEIYDESGETLKAVEILKKALEESNDANTEISTTSTNILYKLAAAYGNMSPLPEQELHRIHNKTIEIQKQIYGDNHPLVAKTYLNYGFFLRVSGQVEKAREYAEMARKIAVSNFSEQHMLTAHIDLLMSQLSFLNDEMQQSIEKLENVVKNYERHYGINHFETNQVKTTLAGYYMKANQGSKALEMLLPLYELQKQQFGEDNKATIYARMNILKAYNLTKDYSKAVQEGEELLVLSRDSLGDEHILTIGVKLTLAESYLFNSQKIQANEMCKHLLEIELIQNNSRYTEKVLSLQQQAQEE